MPISAAGFGAISDKIKPIVTQIRNDLAQGRNAGVEQQLGPVRELRQQFGGLRDRSIQRLGSTAGDRSRVRGLASAFAGQQPRTGTTAATTLQESLRISKARTGIVNRGEAAVENQNLKDRLTQVRGGLNRRAQLVDAAGQATNIKQGVNIRTDAAKAFSQGSDAALFGNILGAGAGFLKGNNDRNGSPFDFGKKNPTSKLPGPAPKRIPPSD